MYPYYIGIIMYITLECDGACNAHGQTSIGIIIRKTIENGSKRIEDKITKLTGTGTAATAEFRARRKRIPGIKARKGTTSGL